MTEVTMKAGRELDALVAEKVMGRRVTWFGQHHQALMFTSTLEANYERDRRGEMMFGYPGDGDVPAYSTDIAAAWEVVEEIQRRGWAVSVNLPWRDDRPDEPYAEIMQQPTFGSEGRFLAVGTTAPHAICLAALKAVGVDV